MINILLVCKFVVESGIKQVKLILKLKIPK